MGKINFIHRFVPDFAQIVKPIHSLLRKDMNFNWINTRHSVFVSIKDAIASASVLAKPDFNKDFQLYTNMTQYTISAILIQPNPDGYERPIAFMIQSLTDAKLKFPYVKKHTLALVVVLRKFCHYIHGCHMIMKLSILAVKHLLSQKYLQGKLANWFAKFQEYDLEFIITKTIKGRKLALHLAQHPEPECPDTKDDIEALFSVFVINQSESGEDNIELPWYDDIVEYLETQTFPVDTKPNE